MYSKRYHLNRSSTPRCLSIFCFNLFHLPRFRHRQNRRPRFRRSSNHPPNSRAEHGQSASSSAPFVPRLSCPSRRTQTHSPFFQRLSSIRPHGRPVSTQRSVDRRKSDRCQLLKHRNQQITTCDFEVKSLQKKDLLEGGRDLGFLKGIHMSASPYLRFHRTGPWHRTLQYMSFLTVPIVRYVHPGRAIASWLKQVCSSEHHRSD